MVNILIGITGSVATIKLHELMASLEQYIEDASIRIVATERSLHFLDLKGFKSDLEILRDCDEWQQWNERGDPVLHIELRKWADLMLISPLDANTLAKIACGICDNLLCSIVRAWDLQRPLLVAPAMNTFMWTHPLTGEHLEKIRSIGYHIVEPVEKKLICGDTGMGAMTPVEYIAQAVLDCLSQRVDQ